MTLEHYAEILTRNSIQHMAERERAALHELRQARDARTVAQPVPRRRRPLRAT